MIHCFPYYSDVLIICINWVKTERSIRSNVDLRDLNDKKEIEKWKTLSIFLRKPLY